MYDYLIVGAGFFGATFAFEMAKKGKKCLVIDRRNHIGGNAYCEKINGINVHKYGVHVFHTSNKEIWNYMNQFTEFNNFIYSPIANYKGEIYNLPFNMNTFSKLWNIRTPKEAKEIIEKQIKQFGTDNPKNLEEQAISLVGKDVYEKLIKEYTEKQWGKECKDLPAFIIRRLPVRFTYDNNYFNDIYQGIPIKGYNYIIEEMLKNCDVRLGVDYIKNREELSKIAKKIIYTGMIDEYFDYKLGNLEWRSLRFEEIVFKDEDNYQGDASVNYTSHEQEYTRIIEHKHFEFNKCKGTVITKEYPLKWEKGMEAYYPINDEKNNSLLIKYQDLAQNEPNVIFGGRLGNYKYYDMDKVIEEALEYVKREEV